MGPKANKRALFPTVSCTSQKHQKSKNLSRAETEEMMAYVPDQLLNETHLQSSTASIGDTENIEVEDNEVNVGIAEYQVR